MQPLCTYSAAEAAVSASSEQRKTRACGIFLLVILVTSSPQASRIRDLILCESVDFGFWYMSFEYLLWAMSPTLPLHVQ